VITCDGGFRGNKEIPLKGVIDDALVQCPFVKRVIVLTRTRTAVSMIKGRDVWWEDEIRKVETQGNPDCAAEEMDAEALAAAKTAAKNEVRAYYNAIDHEKYSEEAEATLSGFVAAAISAIDTATAISDVDAVVTQFKANVDGVEQIQESNSGSDSGKTSSGCGSVVGGMSAATMAAAAAVALLRKKKED
jgi:hypothetical protein